MLRLYFNYYKRLFPINLLISVFMSIFKAGQFFNSFGFFFMTLGFAGCLVYFELTFKDEYYFYSNRGISRLALIAATFGVNALIGISLMAFT